MVREEALEAVYAYCETRELAEEYIHEAEHTEGETYWDAFATVGELLEDVKLYMENRD